MKIISKDMTTPVHTSTHPDEDYISTILYQTYYQIHNFKELLEIIYSHKHNYKPLIGRITTIYKLTYDGGSTIIIPFSWNISEKYKKRTDYIYKITTYDSDGKEHKNKYPIPFTEALPRRIPTRCRKKVYDTLFTVNLGEEIMFNSEDSPVSSITLQEIDLKLYHVFADWSII